MPTFHRLTSKLKNCLVFPAGGLVCLLYKERQHPLTVFALEVLVSTSTNPRIHSRYLGHNSITLFHLLFGS